MTVDDERLQRWQERTDGILLTAAALFLLAYALPVVEPDLPAGVARTCLAVNLVVWGVFAADLAVRVALAGNRRRYLVTNWLDVVAVILPVLRPLRVLRALLALNLLGRRRQRFARSRVMAQVTAAVTTMCAVASLAVLDAERGSPGANITGIGDALWWSVTTVTTVGYGDRYPTTTQGRLIATTLMITGIALLGVLTAALASWFLERLGQVQAADAGERPEADADTDADHLAAEIRHLRDELARLTVKDAPPRTGDTTCHRL